jgi:hypothetical protein
LLSSRRLAPVLQIGLKHNVQGALQLQQLRLFSVVEPGCAYIAGAHAQLHGKVGSNLARVDQHVEKFAAEVNALLLRRRGGPGHFCTTLEAQLGGGTGRDRALCDGRCQLPILTPALNVDFVDFDGVVIRVVAQVIATHLDTKRAFGIEALQGMM